MPQYELMYLLGSQVADTEVPAITEQIKTFVADFGGQNIRETQLGKKKLAYPIKRTRNGYYVVVNFEMDPLKVNQLDAKIRTMDSVIRYILVNLEEHLQRQEKDKIAQSKIVRKQPAEQQPTAPAAETAPVEKPAPKKEKTAPVLEDINQEELDKKIEEALSEDLTK